MSIHQTPMTAAIEACLNFTPVTREKPRIDGWTPERQRGFIAALARLGSVKAACAHIGMSAVGAYYLRRQTGAESFARAWARAHAAGVRSLRDIAYERAVEGTPKGVWWKGERVGEERRYNDRLLMFILRHEDPAVFGEGKRLGGGTKHPDTLAREARWAEEADEEARAEADTARLEELLAMYIEKARAEREARSEGDTYSANFLLRQLTLFEIALSIEGGDALTDRITPAVLGIDDPSGKDPDTSLAAVFAAARRRAWAELGEPERPDLSKEGGSGPHSFGGPTWQKRDAAQREAQRHVDQACAARDAARSEAEVRITEARALYDAAATEEGWAAWTAAPV